MAPDGCFVHVTIPVRDLNRAQRFYVAIFGWNFITTGAGQTSPRMFMTGGDVLGFLQKTFAPPVTDNSARIKAYVKVRDVDATLSLVVAAGGIVKKPKCLDGAYTELAEFEDTEGNLLGIVKVALP